jgi:hypothetical protein
MHSFTFAWIRWQSGTSKSIHVEVWTATNRSRYGKLVCYLTAHIANRTEHLRVANSQCSLFGTENKNNIRMNIRSFAFFCQICTHSNSVNRPIFVAEK